MKYYKTITILILFNIRKTSAGDKDHCIWPCFIATCRLQQAWGGGPRVVVSTAAFHARVRGSVPGLGGLKETKIVSSPSTCES